MVPDFLLDPPREQRKQKQQQAAAEDDAPFSADDNLNKLYKARSLPRCQGAPPPCVVVTAPRPPVRSAGRAST